MMVTPVASKLALCVKQMPTFASPHERFVRLPLPIHFTALAK